MLILEICMGLVRCSRSRPVPAAVIPIPVPVTLKPVGEKNEIENFIQTAHIAR